MTIDIGDVSVSIPTHISNWVHENSDNKTEFDGMIESIMYAVKKFYKEKYKPNPYQKVYEEQVKEYMELGHTKEQADVLISYLIDKQWEEAEKEYKSTLNSLMDLLKAEKDK